MGTIVPLFCTLTQRCAVEKNKKEFLNSGFKDNIYFY